MSESQTSVSSKDHTAESVQQKENHPEVTMVQTSTSVESSDPSASDSKSTTESERVDQLRLFVTLLTVKVLSKCHAPKKCRQEELIAHIKRLVDQTMQDLTIAESFCPDVKSIKKVSKAVLKDLRKKLYSKKLLESVVLLQDPAVDSVIVETLQAHTRDFYAHKPKKTPRLRWGLANIVEFSYFILCLFTCVVSLVLIVGLLTGLVAIL